MGKQTDTVEQAIADIRQGKIIMVIDDPDRDSNGNIWPGLRKSSGLASSSMAARAVWERSKAEIPVSVSMPSIDMVNAVWWLSVFCSTICFKPNFPQSSFILIFPLEGLRHSSASHA